MYPNRNRDADAIVGLIFLVLFSIAIWIFPAIAIGTVVKVGWADSPWWAKLGTILGILCFVIFLIAGIAQPVAAR